MPRDMPVASRRRFLKATAAAGGSLLIAVFVPDRSVSGEALPVNAFQPNAFLRVDPDETVTVIVGLSEMGQGVHTAIAQIVAEELDADWAHIRVEQAPTDSAYNNPELGVQATGGSTAILGHWEPMRKAGATARAMLVAAAAKTWKVDESSCRSESGTVIHATGKRLTYGKLARAAALLPVPAEIRLKDPKSFSIIGTSRTRLESPAKVDGSATFGIDVRLPGMLVAVVARTPVVGGKLVSFSAEKATEIHGVRHVVQIDSGVAVVADGYWAAKAGRDALRLVWDDGPNAELSSEAVSAKMTELAAMPALLAYSAGDLASLAPAQSLEATYEVPYLAHACMEPMNATAWVRADGVEVWAPTESPGIDRDVLAKVAGVEPKKVRVHTTLLGGGFGRRFATDFSIDAVQASKAVGTPVQVIYSREDDIKGQLYRPAAVAKLVATLDASGVPMSFSARIACSSILTAAGYAMKNGIDSVAVEGLKNWPYDTTTVRVEWAPYENGVKVWFLRSVGYSHNIYFVESFIDELAHAAGKDPVEYRHMLLTKHPRHRGVLELAAAKANWGEPLPAGRARGIAVSEFRGTFVAEAVEVSRGDDGRPRVHRVVCAVDCGQIVNPETIRRQLEGAVVFALSAALYGKITLRAGRIEQGNFNDYRIARMDEIPEIDVHIVPSDEKPSGIGEVGVPPLAPALTNALFALTGKRIRALPINPADLVGVRS